MPAFIINNGCRGGIFHSQITPADEVPRFYEKTNVLVKPDIASSISIASGLEMKIPAGGVNQSVNISISTAPPPFSANGSVSYYGDIFTIDNINCVKYSSISFKIPDNQLNAGGVNGSSASGGLRVLYYFSFNRYFGLSEPEIIDGRAVISIKNSFTAEKIITAGSDLSIPLFSSGGGANEIICQAGENEKSEMTVCLISINAVTQFKTANFNFYSDNSAIGPGELSAINAELEDSFEFARGSGFKTPVLSGNKVNVYIMRFVDSKNNPANEVFGLPVRGEKFSHNNSIYLSSSPYDWNRVKSYRQASCELFRLCQNQYLNLTENSDELSKKGWGWFIDASCAWFCAARSADPFAAGELYNSKTISTLISDSDGLFTRPGAGFQRWYFLWVISNKYGVEKIKDMLDDASRLKPFTDSAAAVLTSEDFSDYFDSLMSAAYHEILNAAPLMNFPFSVKLKPLEAGIYQFDIVNNKDVSIKITNLNKVKIYARIRDGVSVNRAISKNIVFRDSRYCELYTDAFDGFADSAIFDKIYIAAFNIKIPLNSSAGLNGEEMAVLMERSAAGGGESFIYPAFAAFDKNIQKRFDINIITVNAGGAYLTSAINGGYSLIEGVDYISVKNGLIIRSSYLASMDKGRAYLTFNFSEGQTALLTIDIIDTTPFVPPLKPGSISFEPPLLILVHASQYDLNGIKITVKYEDGTEKPASAKPVWKISQGEGSILQNNIYRPASEDSELLECIYTEDGAAIVYNYLTVSYSDQKLVPVLKISYNNATAGDIFYYDASSSLGCDMYEWYFDLNNLSGAADESAIIKLWSAESKTSFIYGRGGVFKAAVKIKNSDNPDYIKSSPASLITVKPLPPEVFPLAGNYTNEILITLNAPKEASKIIYTLDGAPPSLTDGNIYAEPFKLNKSAVVKAIAVIEGNEKTSIIVSDHISASYIIERNSYISTDSLEFDKNKPAAFETAVKLELNGNVIESISYKDNILLPEKDYEAVNDILIISPLFLQSLPAGSAALIINFSAGDSCILKIEIFESPVYDSEITPAQVSFDKGIYRADIYITLILNGNELSAIVKDDYELKEGADYTVYNGRIIFKKEYLGSLPLGAAKIVFKFSAGADCALAVNIYQSYIVVETVKNPEFSPAGGTYTTPQSVSLTTGTLNASIRYTLDGSIPSQTNGLDYISPLIVSSSLTIKAIAFKSGMNNSQVVSAGYVILPPAADPVFTPAEGEYLSQVSVGISCATQGASIKYTLDGSDPSASNGMEYSALLLITSTTLIKAVAIKSGISDSQIVSAEYTIIPQAAAPEFAPHAGTYASAQSVVLTTATAGADIRYTTDGTLPTSKTGTVYKKAFAVSSSMVIKAIAYKKNMADSRIVTADYIIEP